MSEASTPAIELAAAELRAQRARDRLHATLGQLQDRLDPRARVKKIKHEAQIAGATAVAVARDKPRETGGAIAGAVLAIGIVLGRHRIARLFVRSRRTDTTPASAGLNPVTRIDP